MQLMQAVDVAELAEIEMQWGEAARQHHRLEVDDPFLTGNHQMLVSDRRRAEICYVMQRTALDQDFLLHIKTFYPPGAFRLPTGGIHQGERVLETLAREITEETGMVVGDGVDEVNVRRFLGLVSYEFHHRSLGRCFEFATYCFLVRMPAGGALNPQDAAESIGGWQWRHPDQMATVAEFLERVGEQAPDWGDWGRYRALGHRFVANTYTPW